MLRVHPTTNQFLDALTNNYSDQSIIADNNIAIRYIISPTVAYPNIIGIAAFFIEVVRDRFAISLKEVEANNITKLFALAIIPALERNDKEQLRLELLNCFTIFLGRMLYPCDINKITSDNDRRFWCIIRNQAKLQGLKVIT